MLEMTFAGSTLPLWRFDLERYRQMYKHFLDARLPKRPAKQPQNKVRMNIEYLVGSGHEIAVAKLSGSCRPPRIYEYLHNLHNLHYLHYNIISVLSPHSVAAAEAGAASQDALALASRCSVRRHLTSQARLCRPSTLHFQQPLKAPSNWRGSHQGMTASRLSEACWGQKSGNTWPENGWFTDRSEGQAWAAMRKHRQGTQS